MLRQPAAPPVGCWLLTPRSPDWPDPWNHVDEPPDLVWGAGDPAALDGPAIAVVGTRRATPRGEAIARRLGADLARRGWTVVSGLARGIDAAAHQGALDADGVTVAVMGTGVDRTYPHRHVDLRRRIERRGCTVTDLPPGAPPLHFHFPRRNRLVSGLAQAVIVVEAPVRSGALLTAYQGLDQGREVFAVPGPVDCDRVRGCHKLLREGAHLLESVDDLHRVLTAPRDDPAAPPPRLPLPRPGSPARWIWDRLDLTGLRLDELRRRWSGSEEMLQEGLLALEAADMIQRLPGGKVVRKIWLP
ncbi:MAG TPA: DNA-processing protein DprA [Candidatus Krumholzibacteria bacterium]|nr:DNA-processing protein DprA [Candidatus Krumholzibacteria bacterium]HRX50679.1 DNA-processing protein DprA [Candidatus Krumholzibacteria bacterium]